MHRIFRNDHIPSAVIGVGIDVARSSKPEQSYFLYAGRIENGKSCQEMFEFTRKAGVPLKIIGQAQIPIPKHVEYLGFVSEAEKEKIMAGCRALIHPSRNESLSLAALEAWAHGKPVIVSAESPVLRAHVEKSGGGYVYGNYEDFRVIVHNIDHTRGAAGRSYVEQNYSWTAVLKKYDEVFSSVLQ